MDYLHELLGSCWSATFGTPLVNCPLLKLHGDLPQAERTSAFVTFTEVGQVWMLLLLLLPYSSVAVLEPLLPSPRLPGSTLPLPAPST